MIRAEARALTAVIALCAVAALGLRLGLTMEVAGEGPYAALWSMYRYFTVITVTALGVVAAMLAMGARPGPQLQAALLLSIGAVAAGHHLILAQLVSHTGLEAVIDEVLHTVIPVLYAAYWLIFAPKTGLRYRLVPLWLIYPLAYCGYALMRGEIDGIYPYPFLDVASEGMFMVLFNIAFLLLVFWIEGVMIVALGRLIRRLHAP